MKKVIETVVEFILIMYIVLWMLCIETATWEMYVVGFGCLLTLLLMARWREVAGFIVEKLNL